MVELNADSVRPSICMGTSLIISSSHLSVEHFSFLADSVISHRCLYNERPVLPESLYINMLFWSTSPSQCFLARKVNFSAIVVWHITSLIR